MCLKFLQITPITLGVASKYLQYSYGEDIKHYEINCSINDAEEIATKGDT